MFAAVVRSRALANVAKRCSQMRSMCDEKRYFEKGLNQVTLMGRCGIDAQLRGSKENPVVIFSLATHNHFKSDSVGLVQKTDWHRISVFKPHLQQRSVSFAKKGSRILVQGRLSYGEITDSSGQTHQTTSIIADDIIFLSPNRSAESADADEEVANQ